MSAGCGGTSTPQPALLAPTRANPGAELRTERLVMRRWRDTDREPFAAMNLKADELPATCKAVMQRLVEEIRVDSREVIHPTFRVPTWAAVRIVHPMVERRGFEPLTSAVRGQRSPS